ncbi:hypothetical protein F0235_12320 [Vibrio splendidus]|uniref:hypothetical protein n=1 Tax=Vibrio splendidus TaxID=29497 RepID=UPI00148BDDF4|nr:hypothetical protein [Vibrio splendidus]NOI91226.1 hypothetical protein [Vibrio splendidus]
MKAIVSLFISAYQPGMASIESQPYSLNHSYQPLFFSDSDGCSEARVYKDKVYDDWPNEELDRSENDCFGGLYFEDQSFEDPNFEGQSCEGPCFEDKRFEGLQFEDARFENPNYEDICWMISRARREAPLGYYVAYLRYVSYHSGYAKTVEASLRQHIALHADLKDSLSTFLVTWLQQQEDLFCQTLHQQLIEFHTSH